MSGKLHGLMTEEDEKRIVRDALTCGCGSKLVPTTKGWWICEKTADKYELAHGKRIKVKNTGN